MNQANHDDHNHDDRHHHHGASGNRHSGDAQLENDIIHRWQNKQSMRSIARELGLNRFKVASIIGAHQKSIASPTANQVPPSLGPAPVLRGSKLDRFEPQLRQLLERYPRITARRVFEELQRLGYDGGYSILRVRVKQLRAKPAKSAGLKRKAKSNAPSITSRPICSTAASSVRSIISMKSPAGGCRK